MVNMVNLDKHDPVGPAARLTAEEDGILRRLHFFEVNGISLAIPMQSLKSELRARDQRIEIREPVVALVMAPAG